MITITGEMDFSELAKAFSAIRGIPVSAIVRNASRDFAQAAFKATPLATATRSPWYWYERGGTRHYLHESHTIGRRRKSLKNLHRVKICKGYSKSTWIGVFKALGMSGAKAGRLDSMTEAFASRKSHAIERTVGDSSSITIENDVRFDRFGKGDTTARHDRIRSAGFALAANRLKSAYEREMIKSWRQ